MIESTVCIVSKPGPNAPHTGLLIYLNGQDECRWLQDVNNTSPHSRTAYSPKVAAMEGEAVAAAADVAISSTYR